MSGLPTPNFTHRRDSFQSTKLPLTIWFLAIYLISQAKTGLSALALKRYLGVSYPTAWLIQHKLMEAMSERETKYTLSGQVQIDDAYFDGELSGGKAGRGSENKVSLNLKTTIRHSKIPFAPRLRSGEPCRRVGWAELLTAQQLGKPV